MSCAGWSPQPSTLAYEEHSSDDFASGRGRRSRVLRTDQQESHKYWFSPVQSQHPPPPPPSSLPSSSRRSLMRRSLRSRLSTTSLMLRRTLYLCGECLYLLVVLLFLSLMLLALQCRPSRRLDSAHSTPRVAIRQAARTYTGRSVLLCHTRRRAHFPLQQSPFARVVVTSRR